VTPRQYRPDRIEREDVQELLKKVRVRTQTHIGKKAFAALDTFTARYPEEVPCKVTIRLNDGREMVREKRDYQGFHTRPMSREEVTAKFESLSVPYTEQALRHEIEDAVQNLDKLEIAGLTGLLARAGR
jgi:2-methylcitrate dehydratase